MQIAMIGLGRMGANMATRLMCAGHECIVYDRNDRAVQELAEAGAVGATDIADLCAQLSKPRAIWIMIPAAVVDAVVDELSPHLETGDIVIDGGNSYYKEDIRHAKRLAEAGIRFLDCGTSGGVWGLERGYCLMIGGDTDAVRTWIPSSRPWRPDPATSSAPRPRRGFERAEQGYLHCGPSGAGHFVKMVHNGIEYALMAAYAEGFNILKHAGVGREDLSDRCGDRATGQPEHYQYDIDVAQVAEVWRRGSVVASWLLDSHRQRAARRPEARRSSADGCPTPEKAAGPAWPRSRPALRPPSDDRTLRALQLPRRGGFRQSDPVGDALPVRRAPRKED